MSHTQTFSTAAVLAMTTGLLTCELEEFYAIASFMIGRPVYSHELPRAFEVCAPDLKRQFPELAAVTGNDITKANVHDWIRDAVLRFGASREVQSLGWNRLADQAPLDTLSEMIDPSRIITVDGHLEEQ